MLLVYFSFPNYWKNKLNLFGYFRYFSCLLFRFGFVLLFCLFFRSAGVAKNWGYHNGLFDGPIVGGLVGYGLMRG
jgi:hypothetical protein